MALETPSPLMANVMIFFQGHLPFETVHYVQCAHYLVHATCLRSADNKCMQLQTSHYC